MCKCAGAHESQKKVRSTELEFIGSCDRAENQTWILGRAATSINCRVVSPVPAKKKKLLLNAIWNNKVIKQVIKQKVQSIQIKCEWGYNKPDMNLIYLYVHCKYPKPLLIQALT